MHRTVDLPFFRDNGDMIGFIPMMNQRRALSYVDISSLGASVVELPYGDDGEICMWLFQSFGATNSTEVLNNLRKFDVATINHALHKFDNNEDYEPNEIDLTMPPFNIETNLEISDVLRDLGIDTVLDSSKADLSKISSQSPNVFRLFHKAVIEVNAEGTVAAAAAGAAVSFKQSPIIFILDRPFNFMIINRATNITLFAGQVQNPLD